MRTLAFTILTMSIALTAGQASAQTYGPRFRVSPAPYANAPDSYCLQGRDWGYPGNCQFSSYAQYHGHRERYFLLLRDQSPLRVRPPAARRLSTPILSGSEAIDRTRRAGNAGADCGHEGIEPGRTAVSGRWHAFTSNWRELTSHWPRIADRVVQTCFVADCLVMPGQKKESKT